MSRIKKGSITAMEKILWKPDKEDKVNLAYVEKWYMDRCEVSDCSEISGAAILRAMTREFVQIMKKRALATKAANSKKGVDDDRDED